MKAVAGSLLALVLSLFIAVRGIYGCSANETARWGQPQDNVTHFYAGLAYLGLIGTVVSIVCLVIAVVFIVTNRRRYTKGE